MALDPLTQAIVDMLPKPERLGEKVVVEGDPEHRHKLVKVPWDRSLPVDHVDLGPKGSWMATYRYLYYCSCGREVYTETRALI